MRFSLFFNLFAELIKRISALDTPATISDESKELTKKQVDDYLKFHFEKEKFLSHDTLPLTSQIVFDIIQWAESFNNYWLYKTLLERLESMINLKKLVYSLDINNISSGDPLFFCALNNNQQETGVLILPKVSSPKTEHTRKQDDEDLYITRPTAKTWYNPINEFLKKCYFITCEDLRGYKVKNIMLSAPDDAIKDGYITIGVTPVCNIPMVDILSFDDDIEKMDNMGNVSYFFGNVSVKNPPEINERYCNAYQLACNNNVPYFIRPRDVGNYGIKSIGRGYESSIQAIISNIKLSIACYSPNFLA